MTTKAETTSGISVVLCTYNNAEYLVRCINSILEQKYSPLEVIIVDDASTDSTQEVLSDFRGKRGFVFLKNERNIGLTRSLNLAVEKASHLIIARIDADDQMLPGRLKEQAKILARDDVILSGSGAILQYEDEGFSLKPVRGDAVFKKSDKLLVNPFAHSSVTFKKTAFNQVGGYDESFLRCQDFDLWTRMQALGCLHFSSTNGLFVGLSMGG